MSVSKENIEAAKKLIERYRSITADEIIAQKNGDFSGKDIMSQLTKFSLLSCSICLSVRMNCNLCVYSINNKIGMISCTVGDNSKTYHDIAYAQNTDELLSALRNRADHIENLLKQIEEEQK